MAAVHAALENYSSKEVTMAGSPMILKPHERMQRILSATQIPIAAGTFHISELAVFRQMKLSKEDCGADLCRLHLSRSARI
jgi:hypothetical protein